MKILRRIFEEKKLKSNYNILIEIVVVSEIDVSVVLFDCYHILRMVLMMVDKVMLMSPALHDARCYHVGGQG
jgi:hypothetical protein